MMSPEQSRRLKIQGWIFFVLFVGCVWLANWFIMNVGIQLDPNSPVHVVPVWFWPVIYAPSGVLVVGVSFTLRDLVQRRLGKKYTAIAVVIGAGLSALISPALALASGTAFFVSEMADLFVYTPIRKRSIVKATIASNTVGLIVDSVVFLLLAFGSLQFLLGQVIGKAWMTALALPVVMWIEKRDRESGIVHAE